MLYVPATGLLQLAVIVKPLIENDMPIGAPVMDTDTQVMAPESAMLIVPVSNLPTTPVMAGAVITGPAVAIFTVVTPWPLRPVLVSLATTVTVYVPSTGLAQLTTPELALFIPAGAPLKL